MLKNKKHLLWLIIIVLFVVLQIYNFVKGHYADLLLTAGIFLIIFLVLAGFALVQKRKNNL